MTALLNGWTKPTFYSSNNAHVCNRYNLLIKNKKPAFVSRGTFDQGFHCFTFGEVRILRLRGSKASGVIFLLVTDPDRLEEAKRQSDRLPFKTMVSIFIHRFKKSLQSFYRGQGTVCVPFQVGAHPVNIPVVFGTDKGGFRIRQPLDAFRIEPLRADLHKIDTLPFYIITDIQLGTDFGRWTHLFKVLFQNALILC